MVRPWYPPEFQDLFVAAAWVKFQGMPFHLYHESVLKQIASLLGKLLKIDYNMSSEKRGKFSRIAIELDLSKPLLPRFLLNGRM